jgi:HK97 family phage prohead protease
MIEIYGYASIFDIPDLVGDIVDRDAFSKTLRRRGASDIPMLFEHRPALLVGKWESVAVTDAGLSVMGLINTRTDVGCWVINQIFASKSRGLSIGFKTVRSKIKRGHRHILEIDLWEISVVLFPTHPQSLIHGFRERKMA